jgi:c-di-GMP-binding flagellar brake protein YcgR
VNREARQSPRYALEAAVEICAGPLRARGRTNNLSRGGMCLIVEQAVERGAEIEVRLALVFDAETASEPLDLPARVVWSTPLATGHHQLGIAFLSLGTDQRSYLDMFLRYLEEGQQAEEEVDDQPSAPEDPFAK